MAFKSPYITKKAIVNKVTDLPDLPQFRYEDLKENSIVGRGSFGVVVKARTRFRLGCSGCEEVTGGKCGRPVTLFIIVLVKADADYVIHVMGPGRGGTPLILLRG